MADEPARQTLSEKTALNDRTRPKRESCLPSVYLIVVDRPHPLEIEEADEYTALNVVTMQRLPGLLHRKNAIHRIVIELSYITPILCASRKEESNHYSRMVRLH